MATNFSAFTVPSTAGYLNRMSGSASMRVSRLAVDGVSSVRQRPTDWATVGAVMCARCPVVSSMIRSGASPP